MDSPHHVIIDLYDCIPFILSNKVLIAEFIETCIKMGNMTPVGIPIGIQFQGTEPLDNGITYAQTLGESLISLHTYPREKSVYIDIFSCKVFDSETMFMYAKTFFRGKGYCQRVNRMKYMGVKNLPVTPPT